MNNAKNRPSISELKNFDIFKDLEVQNIELLCENSFIQAHSHKQILFNFGESAHYFAIVLNGAYKLSRFTPTGEESVIHFSTIGDVIAALILSQPQPVFPVTVKAMGPSRVLLIPKETYLTHWFSKPSLIIKIQGLLSTRMSRLQHQKVMLRSPMAPKIASLLMQLAASESNNQNEDEEMKIPLPLTRKEIADTLGVTVESVIRVMSEWVKQEFIETNDQFIKILKPEKLIEIIEG